ncbi:hypothetical protein [Burkholderia multivorans]|uniref:hypothetical protein n=1 Tax=Burkholderia multivorans TaxID=87883 RepID=UPI0021C1CFC4|nr:hypothetical protein [Burkholderia multivorans]
MNEIKHTPGPWYWDDRYPTSSTGEKTWSLIGADGYGILSCDGIENSPQGLNDYGNAKLIESAPDIALALEMIAAEDDAARHNGTPLLTSGVRMTLDAALIKAGRKEAPERNGD